MLAASFATVLVAGTPAGASAPVPLPAPPSAARTPPVPRHGQALALQPVWVSLPRRYEAFQAQFVPGPVTPWAAEAAGAAGIDLADIAAAVGVSGSAPGDIPLILTSPVHRTGRFTYIRSDAARLYQIVPVTTAAVPHGFVAVLAAAGPPAAPAMDVRDATWILGLVPRQGGPGATVRLHTRLPRAPALWDSIATSLFLSAGKLVALVSYGHTGGGDPCDRDFLFVVRAEDGPRLAIERASSRQGPCDQLGEPGGD